VKQSHIAQLRIDPEKKRRPSGTVRAIFIIVILALAASAWFAWPKAEAERRVAGEKKQKPDTAATALAEGSAPPPSPAPRTSGPAAQRVGTTPASMLTVSGYIINRERIELSPRFPGIVAWVGVKKGDTVDKNQVVVRLDDAEQRANVATAEARLASALVGLEKAEILYRRTQDLHDRHVLADDAFDDARLALAAARTAVKESESQVALARTYLDWTVIRSPISGVVLEKLAQPGELVTPQSFGGSRGPSTAVLAVADPQDLQVELDINESDLAKIALGDACRVIPEAYPDRTYDGVVAEISPEANRQKGTLQIKVGILRPDKHLTPELTAKVEFPGAKG
jgi:HlyD family secretion protein